MLEEVYWFKSDKENWYTFKRKYPLKYAIEIYPEILNYIEQNIENPYKHCRWLIDSCDEVGLYEITVKFRYERNYLIFLLVYA